MSVPIHQKIRRQVAACKSRGIQALVRGEARLNDHFMGKYGKVIKRYPDVSYNVGPPVISWFINPINHSYKYNKP